MYFVKGRGCKTADSLEETAGYNVLITTPDPASAMITAADAD